MESKEFPKNEFSDFILTVTHKGKITDLYLSKFVIHFMGSKIMSEWIKKGSKEVSDFSPHGYECVFGFFTKRSELPTDYSEPLTIAHEYGIEVLFNACTKECGVNYFNIGALEALGLTEKVDKIVSRFDFKGDIGWYRSAMEHWAEKGLSRLVKKVTELILKKGVE